MSPRTSTCHSVMRYGSTSLRNCHQSCHAHAWVQSLSASSLTPLAQDINGTTAPGGPIWLDWREHLGIWPHSLRSTNQRIALILELWICRTFLDWCRFCSCFRFLSLRTMDCEDDNPSKCRHRWTLGRWCETWDAFQGNIWLLLDRKRQRSPSCG